MSTAILAGLKSKTMLLCTVILVVHVSQCVLNDVAFFNASAALVSIFAAMSISVVARCVAGALMPYAKVIFTRCAMIKIDNMVISKSK